MITGVSPRALISLSTCQPSSCGQQQEIGFACLVHGQGCAAIGGMQGAQSVALQVSGEDVGDLGFILCNQYQ
ncbi:hypothetical protein [Aeromonas caviae]|nr:hypothetical protein [Aeromonas caviae]UBS67668.1 hypothetical protein LCG53_05820 [Aeromonas caviae]